MFKAYKSHKDEAECVLNLIEICTTLINKYKYPDNDTRSASIVNIRLVSYSCLGILNLLENWTTADTIIRQNIPLLLGLTQIDSKSVKLMGDSLHKTSKLSLSLLAQFQIENCIKNICQALKKNHKKGFYNIANDLLTYLGKNHNAIEILNTNALIRNSLHTNGIHYGFKGSDFHSNLKGIRYDFFNGQKVSCASFPHISHAIECSIEVLDDIFSTRQLKSHTSLIPDLYASYMGLGK